MSSQDYGDEYYDDEDNSSYDETEDTYLEYARDMLAAHCIVAFGQSCLYAVTVNRTAEQRPDAFARFTGKPLPKFEADFVDAVQRMFTLFNLNNPWDDMLQEDRIAIEQSQQVRIQRLENERERGNDLLQKAQERETEKLNILHVELLRLVSHVDAMVRSQVSHEQRRGQLVLLTDLIKAVETTVRMGEHHIPL